MVRLPIVNDSPLRTREPENSHGGLEIEAFDNPGLLWSIRKATSLLEPSKRRLLVLAAVLQVSLAFLDLIGIVLIGLVAAVAVSGFGYNDIPAWAQEWLSRLGLESLTISQLSVLLALIAVTTLITKTVLSALLSRRIIRFLAARQAEVSASLAKRFLRRPLAEVQRWTTSEAVYALGNGVYAATTALLASGITIAAEVFLFTIVGISLLVYDPLLTISAIALFSTVVFLLHRILGRMTARNADLIREASIDTMTAVSEALSTYRETTVLHRRDLYADRYAGLVSKYSVAGASNAFILEIPKYVLEIALYLGLVLLGIVQFLTKDWAAAATTLAVFLAASSRIMPGILRLQGATITIKNASVAAQPTFFMADYLASCPDTPDTSAPRMSGARVVEEIEKGYVDFKATVTADHVSFHYPDAPNPAVADVSFNLAIGRSLAFVGSTGAGKSTLTDLVLGVLDPESGHLRISGRVPREAIQQWPGAIAYVPQSVSLIGGTVRDNVALGLPKALVDDELVWEALRRAHLADFLVDSREGLETPIGERGFRLSGGQRQRLGIARALYTRPRLLVLDEATSALDSETERSIVATLAELEGEVTTITVAHRLATVRNCDELLYLSLGHVTARGTFDEVRSQAADFDHQASLLGL